MLNVSFTGLKGLSDPQNQVILKNMGTSFKEDFTIPAREVFEKIDEASGQNDVFVKLSENNIIQVSSNRIVKQYNIDLKNEKGKTLASTFIRFQAGSQSGKAKQINSENCKKALYGLEEAYISKYTKGKVSNDIEYMINRFA